MEVGRGKLEARSWEVEVGRRKLEVAKKFEVRLWKYRKKEVGRKWLEVGNPIIRGSIKGYKGNR